MSTADEFEPASLAQPFKVELTRHRQGLPQTQGASLLKNKFSIIFGIEYLKETNNGFALASIDKYFVHKGISWLQYAITKIGD